MGRENRRGRIVDLQAEIRKEIAELVSLIGEIHEKIELLENPTEKAVLTERYINVKSWEEIAEIISYSERNTKYIHGRALKNFALFCTFLH